MKTETNGKFSLGRVVATPNALEAISGEEMAKALARHAAGDWGECGREDWQENELSLWLDGIPLYAAGAPLEFDDRALSERIRSEREVKIRLKLERGPASIRFWTLSAASLKASCSVVIFCCGWFAR